MIFQTHIVSHKKIAQGTHELTLVRPDGFIFSPGQYVQVALPKQLTSDPKGSYRLFSISSPPENLEILRFVFRESPSGFKQSIMTLTAQQETVLIDQASGSFKLSAQTNKPQVFVAGGVGIAPFMSLLSQEDLQKKIVQPVTLIYGNRDESSSAYLPQLRELSEAVEGFSLVELYDSPSAELFREIALPHTDSVWNVVGPPGMVDLAVQGLQQAGVSMQNIITESFDGY